MFVVSYLAAIILAILYSNIVEWLAHKYVLHGIGKNKNNFWSFHWKDHHKKSKKNNFFDQDYLNDWTGPPLREKIGLFFLLFAHSPLAFIYPIFFITLIFCTVRYYYMHKYAHLNPTWAYDNLRCHYDHHMGKNQDANWGVTTGWVDKVAGTRVFNYNDRKPNEPFINLK